MNFGSSFPLDAWIGLEGFALAVFIDHKSGEKIMTDPVLKTEGVPQLSNHQFSTTVSIKWIVENLQATAVPPRAQHRIGRDRL